MAAMIHSVPATFPNFFQNTGRLLDTIVGGSIENIGEILNFSAKLFGRQFHKVDEEIKGIFKHQNTSNNTDISTTVSPSTSTSVTPSETSKNQSTIAVSNNSSALNSTEVSEP